MSAAIVDGGGSQALNVAWTEAPADPFTSGARIGRAGALAIALVFGAAAAWLCLARLDGSVVIAAQVKVEDERKAVQHLEGGIVSALLVRPGDKVKAGQALLQLEEVMADAAVEGLQDQLDAERGRSARADSQRLLRDAVAFAPDARERATHSPKLKSLLAAEAELFTARRRQLLGETALLRQQARQVQAEIVGQQVQVASADVNRKLITDELEMNRELYRREFVQRTRLMTFERALAEKDERRGAYAAELAKAKQKLVEIELAAIRLQDDYVKRASDEYTEANRRVLELQERIRPLRNTLLRQIVVAPTDGEVVDLRVHTVGGVIAPREVLMEIVPEHPALLVEGKVRPEDVADLHLGQRVDIQITAFRQRSTPLLGGRLSYVSGDSMSTTVNGVTSPHFLVQATVDADAARLLPSRLLPGMPATLFIRTQSRSALDYLLQPLSDSMRKAFNER